MNFGEQTSEYAEKTIGLYGGKFYPLHNGHINCIREAAKMVDILFVVVNYDHHHEKTLADSAGDFEPVSVRLRERWISQSVADIPNVRVFSAYEKRTDDYLTDPAIGVTYDSIRRTIGQPIVRVFGTEPEYADYFAKWVPEAEYVLLFGGVRTPEAATDIRSDLNEHWGDLPPAVQQYYKPRVAVVGPESSGKSYTARHAAEAAGFRYVPEYGREYFEKLNGWMDIEDRDDYTAIAVGQLESIRRAVEEENSKYIVLDTDLIYTQYFYIRSFGEPSEVLSALIHSQAEKIDHYLYIEPRQTYQLDGTRMPASDEQRLKDSEQLKMLYRSYGRKLIVIDELNPEVRLEKAVDEIRACLRGQLQGKRS